MTKLKYDDSEIFVAGPALDKDEPYFIIRGNDMLALDVIRAYMDNYVALNTNIPDAMIDDDKTLEEVLREDENYLSLREALRRFEAYQQRFSARVRYPD